MKTSYKQRNEAINEYNIDKLDTSTYVYNYSYNFIM